MKYSVFFYLLFMFSVVAENVWTFTPDGNFKDWIVENKYVFKSFSLIVVFPGWEKTIELSSAEFASVIVSENKAVYSGLIEKKWGRGDDIRLRFREEFILSDYGKTLTFRFGASAEKNVNIEGIYLKVMLPVKFYGKGSAVFYNNKRKVKSVLLNNIFSGEAKVSYIYGSGYGDGLAVKDYLGINGFIFHTYPNNILNKFFIQIQDERKWGQPYFLVLCRLYEGKLSKNQKISFQSEFTAKACRNINLIISKSAIANKNGINAARGFESRACRHTGRYSVFSNSKFFAFGGNYCFGENSEETKITLKEINSKIVRVDAHLNLWEPENDNKNPEKMNWHKYATSDKRICRELNFMKKIARGKVLIVSVWDIPIWLYNEKSAYRKTKRILNPGSLPELCECVASYLFYAKRKYKVEADFFSFNEPDLGINTYFPPNIYTDLLSKLIDNFEKLGLKTKVIIGDMAHPRNSWNYLRCVFKSPHIIRNAGAIAFHSWGDASPHQYRYWHLLSEKYKLPLFVTEGGYDPNAWKYNSFNSWNYALREIRVYMKILAYARPAVIMAWELTSDYSMFKKVKKKNSYTYILRPTPRFFFYKQLAKFTKCGSIYLNTAVSSETLIAVAFLLPVKNNKPEILLHIFNNSETQYLTINTFLEHINERNILMYVSSWNMNIEKKCDFFTVEPNELWIKLYPWSLTTLLLSEN